MHLGRLVQSAAPSHQQHAAALASVISIAGTPMGDNSSAGNKRARQGGDRTTRAALRDGARNAASIIPCSMHLYFLSELFHQSCLLAIRHYNSQPVPFRVRFEPPVRALPRVATLSVFTQTISRTSRLDLLGSGMLGMLAQRLTEAIVQPVKLIRRVLMTNLLRRVVSGRAAATPEGLFKKGLNMYDTHLYAAAAAMFETSATLGNARAYAEQSWLLMHGREGVAQNVQDAFDCAAQSSRLGCMHGSGVLAYCLARGIGCRRAHWRSVQLARASAAAGSRYGQFVMGCMYRFGCGGLARDQDQCLVYLRLAAAQGLDAAQCYLGDMYADGHCVARDLAEAMRWWQLAGAQGHPVACYVIGYYHQRGCAGVAADMTEAFRWYQRAAAAGHHSAASQLQRLGS